MRPFRCGLSRGPFPKIGRVRRNFITYNKDNSLHKEFIIDWNIVYDKILDNDKGHEIKVTFDHVDGSWKYNWLIDAVILERINE